MRFNKSTLADFNVSRSLEWIETNGLGGYASGTVSGAHSRRYHGLLVAATKPPVGRMIVLSKLDETINTGFTSYALGTNQYPGALHPNGYNFLERFERDLFPEFYYRAGDIFLKKTIAAIYAENTTVIIYEVLEAPEPFELELLPLYASRDFHGLSRANDYIGKPYIFEDHVFRTLNYHCCPELFIAVPNGRFVEQRGWYYNFEYSVEQYRGLDYKEDLYSHGKFFLQMEKGAKIGLIVSTDDPTGQNALDLFEKESTRRKNLTVKFLPNRSVARLALAADQFIVKRGKHSTIVAGYHWFADWGRDTMISLPGICLSTGRVDEAKQILLQFAESVSQGMIPNRFPEHGEVLEYNTLDASLWFFNAIYQYYKRTNDKEFVGSLLPVLKEIVE